ncbi:Uncharacterized protein Fot_27503 [Forsythia ovata]|uniref:Uncharacterized protein n=1 Tax=Forsythia ovata TaxID=205694 RepID=A0ABD1TLD4_9LAMI
MLPRHYRQTWGASALGALLAAGPKTSGRLDLLVVGVGELASLLGAGGDDGSSVEDSVRGDESKGGEAERVEDFRAEDFGRMILAPTLEMMIRYMYWRGLWDGGRGLTFLWRWRRFWERCFRCR